MGKTLIIGNGAKTINPRLFVVGGLITSADCDCKASHKMAPPVPEHIFVGCILFLTSQMVSIPIFVELQRVRFMYGLSMTGESKQCGCNVDKACFLRA